MRLAIFVAIGILLATWYESQPDIAVYPLMILAGMGLRLLLDSLEKWRTGS